MGQLNEGKGRNLLNKIDSLDYFEDIRQKIIVGGQIRSDAEQLFDRKDVLYFELKDIVQGW